MDMPPWDVATQNIGHVGEILLYFVVYGIKKVSLPLVHCSLHTRSDTSISSELNYMCILLKRFRTTSCKGEAEIVTEEPRNIPVVSKSLFPYRLMV